MSEELDNNFAKAEYLQNLLIAAATGGGFDNSNYRSLRRHFISDQETMIFLPQFVKVARDLDQFWQFIQGRFGTYRERRMFIYEEFTPLLDHLESHAYAPADSYAPDSVDRAISDALRDFNEPGVHEGWDRALRRRKQDPEGAITAARSLLESVCKHILDDKGVPYNKRNSDLHDLYKMTANELNLSPEQHEERLFRKILGGCASVVSGLGELRNRYGDAHGAGKRNIRPAPRHAGLAVNLAGSLAMFLVQTYMNQRDRRT